MNDGKDQSVKIRECVFLEGLSCCASSWKQINDYRCSLSKKNFLKKKKKQKKGNNTTQTQFLNLYHGVR